MCVKPSYKPKPINSVMAKVIAKAKVISSDISKRMQATPTNGWPIWQAWRMHDWHGWAYKTFTATTARPHGAP
jgi:hypothetical protein